MATVIIDVPDNKANDLSKYVKKLGGHIVAKREAEEKDSDEDDVTHGVFFGENIKRAIEILKG